MTHRLKVIATEPLLSSFVFAVERRTVTDGDETFERDVATHRGAVAILAIDDRNRVGVIRQYRATIDTELWEIPAGTIDAGEDDDFAVAKRELAEEMGIAADRWQRFARTLNSPGWTNQVMHLFEARDLTEVERTPLGPEERRSSIAWWDEAAVRAYLDSDQPIDATTALAFHHYLLLHGHH